ncbi:hypothetical protein [Gryllotalpicola koreensis]|uniref:Uncharacterized protein n=1 Tax=Gryllotalpicola koreensis TaxID=993086 RepID=A0ABP8A2Y5_9MICO
MDITKSTATTTLTTTTYEADVDVNGDGATTHLVAVVDEVTATIEAYGQVSAYAQFPASALPLVKQLIDTILAAPQPSDSGGSADNTTTS